MNTFREMAVEATKSDSAEALYPLKEILFRLLYNPSQYPDIVEGIESIFTGKTPDFSTWGGADDNTKWNPEPKKAHLGIACSDSSLRVEDVDDFFSVYQAQYAESSFGDVAIRSRVECTRWKFSAAEQIDLNKLRNVNTSHPILVVNGRYDPTTSLRSAWEVSTKFRGSRVVVHEGAGVSVLP
jgi:hypothetical protein